MLARLLAAVAALAGCYAPTAIEGAPCAANGACPTGQTCDPETRRCSRGPIDGAIEERDAAAIDASADAPDGPMPFVDDFGRPDGDAIGNGWIEKTPAAWRLADGTASKQLTTASDYRDNLVYRPAAEDIADVEIVMDVRFSATPPGYAQMFVRGRSATMSTANKYDGYLLYVVGSAPDDLVLGRQLGGVFVVTLATLQVSEPFAVGVTYRFTLRATGQAPVALYARVERGGPVGFTPIGEVAVDDAAPERIVEAGTVGFSGSDEATYAYDRFTRSPR